MVVTPFAACAASAAVTCGRAWPTIAPVSPRQKSMNSLPSISVNLAPLADSKVMGKEPGQRVIHAIGTPAKR